MDIKIERSKSKNISEKMPRTESEALEIQTCVVGPYIVSVGEIRICLRKLSITLSVLYFGVSFMGLYRKIVENHVELSKFYLILGIVVCSNKMCLKLP